MRIHSNTLAYWPLLLLAHVGRFCFNGGVNVLYGSPINAVKVNPPANPDRLFHFSCAPVHRQRPDQPRILE